MCIQNVDVCFHSLAWPDQSCPDIVQPLIELVKNVEKSRIELSGLNKSSGPVVVHCRYIPNINNLPRSNVIFLYLLLRMNDLMET